jgi:hypothetical protein
MKDYTGQLHSIQQNFASAGLSSVDPQQPFAEKASLNNDFLSHDSQEVLKCPGDYTRTPLGWRISPFMGKCGFKIQLHKFYAPDSPCYPIQDISCMGAAQKKAWASICKAEFPCKPFSYPPAARIASSATGSRVEHESSSISEFLSALTDHLWIFIGASAASCIGTSYLLTRERKKDDSDTNSDKSN